MRLWFRGQDNSAGCRRARRFTCGRGGAGDASDFDCRRVAGQAYFVSCAICARWRTVMAKGQKRSNREAKKPKADKKKTLASAAAASSTLGKPKPGAATAERRK
jgi:hypothetical protein